MATLLLGPKRHIHRVFRDHLEIPHYKYSPFMATLFLVCHMNHNISKLWGGDDFYSTRYMPPSVFNRVCRLMGECGLSRQFSLRFWEHLENAFNTAGLAMDCRVGLRWYFRYDCPISKPRPVLGFSSKNQGPFFFFFKKSKNELVRPKTMVLGILAKF